MHGQQNIKKNIKY